MSLRFRNIEAQPSDPVDTWGVEGIVAAIERGGLAHLQRIVRAVDANPTGPVAQDLAEATEILSDPDALGFVKARLLDSYLRRAQDSDAEVAHQVQSALDYSGVSLREFADRIGTSASRLSTYATGSTRPSAAKLIEIQRASVALSRQGQA